LYFDWNEVRVSTIRELQEIFRNAPNPAGNASRLKDTLQSIFESQYSFDLDHLKKQNLGKAVSMLEAYRGATQFTVAYVTQTSLGGHAIPLGEGGLDVMYIVAAIDDKERAEGIVPGLERAIPKSKGVEFGSLLHHIAAELAASPTSTKLRAIFAEINPDCKDRLPKRKSPKKVVETDDSPTEVATAEPEAEADADSADKKKVAKAKAPKSMKKEADEESPKKPTAPKKKEVKKAVPKKVTKKTDKLVKKVAKKVSKKSASKQLARKKPR